MSLKGRVRRREFHRIGIFLSRSITLLALSSVANGDTLRPGEFIWEPEISPSGPVVVVISLPDQTLNAYRNGVRVASSTISSGAKGRSTPAGVFTILEKQVTHFSNKYNHAPMPYMQRLTWEGVALHGGDLPGYPASHGCIRLPHEFAKRFYTLTARGTTVIVVDEKDSKPTFASQPIFVASEGDEAARSDKTEFEWNPQRSEEGPITILASGADQTVYVYRNGIAIGRATLKIEDASHPLGGHAYTMLAGLADTPSAFVQGRPARQWMVVKTDSTKGITPLEKLARRVQVPPEFAEKIYDIVTPGTTIVVTDAPALTKSPSNRLILLMETDRK
jgi:hypothetical protein